jgi:hypothetical protein
VVLPELVKFLETPDTNSAIFRASIRCAGLAAAPIRLSNLTTLDLETSANGPCRTRNSRPPPAASGTPTSLAAAELKAGGRNMCHGSASASAVLITVQYSA